MNECRIDECMDEKDGGWGGYLILSHGQMLWMKKSGDKLMSEIWAGLYYLLTPLILDMA